MIDVTHHTERGHDGADADLMNPMVGAFDDPAPLTATELDINSSAAQLALRVAANRQAARNSRNAMVDTQEALEALVRADGNIGEAALELNTSASAILAAVVGDGGGSNQLASYLRAYTTAKCFGLINELQSALVDNLDSLPARDVARTLVSLIQALNGLTDTHTSTQNINVSAYDTLMKSVPPNVRDALRIVSSEDISDAEIAS